MPHTDQGQSPPLSEFVSDLPACDILMQMDNMLEGGMENVVTEQAAFFAKRGYKAAILVLGEVGKGAEKARSFGVHVCHFPYDEDGLERLIRHAGPKLVFAHYSVKGARIYAELDIPFVQVLHNAYAWFSDAQTAAFNQAIPWTSLFVAVSEAVREYSLAHFPIAAEKCVVISNGIETRRFSGPKSQASRKRLRASYGFAPDDYLFLSVGSLVNVKRTMAALKAFAHVRALCPNSGLLIAGYPYSAEIVRELTNSIEEYGLSGQVVYAGHNASPEELYGMADAFVHAAAIEGGQLTLLEALAANLSIIITDVGFARHFAGLPGIAVVDGHFDYHASKITNELFQTPAALVADLSLAMLKTYRERKRPDLPALCLDAMDNAATYEAYLALARGLISGKPAFCWEDWPARLPGPRVAPEVQDSEELHLRNHILRVEAGEREKAITERDARIHALLQSRSWRLTAPLRALGRFTRTS